ncbi:hypothetical protein I580_00447 [Enterococcus caccae ATCC BAA-1240]|uniref:Uncharacterized protein n=1 Tax=Enterococcus caccae ATCC BAA-1240 TaxID=1158612 RepID=R3WNY9_9ENTE|nr:hypothetical protein UC7_02865 [Enterococcus caccae ATCC BAA-1240]EOT68065.1 hypothetical protein I580_00447 [Enterococcus caccae ATCC BAA-1240]
MYAVINFFKRSNVGKKKFELMMKIIRSVVITPKLRDIDNSNIIMNRILMNVLSSSKIKLHC